MNFAYAVKFRRGMGSMSFVKDFLNETFINDLGSVYSIRNLQETEKGKWRLYMRNGQTNPSFLNGEKRLRDGFFMFYTSNDNDTHAVVSGETTDYSTISNTQEVLTEKFLEQRRFLAWPPKNLYHGKSIEYSVPRLGALLFAGAAIDAANKDLQAYLSKALFDSISWANTSLGADETVAFITLGLGVPVAALTGVLVALSYSGRVADKIRLKNMPEEFENFTFGNVAYAYADNEIREFKNETKLINEYNKLPKPMPKEDFLRIRSVFSNIRDQAEASRILKDNGLTIDDMLEAYAK